MLSVSSITYWLNREYSALQLISERFIEPLARRIDNFIHLMTNDFKNPNNWDISTVLGFSICILLVVFVIYNMKTDNDIKRRQVQQQ